MNLLPANCVIRISKSSQSIHEIKLVLEPGDEQLALDIQHGDEQSLTLLIERHYAALVCFLERLNGGNHALAEDTAQDVFMRTIHNIQQYQYPRPFKAWLYTIATNLARNTYRRGEEHRTVQVEERTLDNLAAVNDPIAQAEDAQYIASLLATLPDHQRETILLRYFGDLSLAEIAIALNIPVGTVKSRLSLGLRQLKALLEPETL
jgi:RNA polymerase sigma-70 factor (ECF subfamily)